MRLMHMSCVAEMRGRCWLWPSLFPEVGLVVPQMVLCVGFLSITPLVQYNGSVVLVEELT